MASLVSGNNTIPSEEELVELFSKVGFSNKDAKKYAKTKKTAGTSIELDLSQLMDQNDIVTKIAPVEPGHTPRNYILENINNQMSTYQNNSEISIFNRMKSNLPYKISSDFYYVLEKSNYYF